MIKIAILLSILCSVMVARLFAQAGISDNTHSNNGAAATAGINSTAPDNTLLIYPNPIEQNATLEYTLNKEEEVSIRLVDMQGRIVQTMVADELQGAGEYKQPIFLPEKLAAGSYLIVISSPEEQMSIKIIK